MKSKLNGVIKSIKAEVNRQYGMTDKLTSLSFCSLGAAMINGLPFSFVIDNLGGASEKGLCVSLSGDAVTEGRLTAGDIELRASIKGRQTLVKKKLLLVEKKDGKKILQAKFSSLYIENGIVKGESDEERFQRKLKNQLKFTFTPSYHGKDEEVMLTVYPYESVLEGAASKWRYVCEDESSVEKYLDKR